MEICSQKTTLESRQCEFPGKTIGTVISQEKRHFMEKKMVENSIKQFQWQKSQTQ